MRTIIGERTARKISQTGYIFSPDHGWWSVVVPEATVNLVANNPSFERDDLSAYVAGTTTWLIPATMTRTIAAATTETACGTVMLYGTLVLDGTLDLDGSCGLVRDATDQRRGVYSGLVTVGGAAHAGVSYEISLTAGTTYTFSADVLAATNVPMRLQIVDTSTGLIIATASFRGKGRWRRLAVTGGAVTTGTHLLIISKDGSASTHSFRVDGLQVEAKSYPTTYCDGDQRGLVRGQQAYTWTGTPHASTSTRSAQTRAGGRVVSFDEYRFRVRGQIGLGMPPLNNVATSLGLIGGALYQRTVPQSRPFTIIGDFGEASYAQLMRDRQGMIDALTPARVALQQPLKLRYQVVECDDDYGDELEIVCLYEGGLEGATTNLIEERVPIVFTAYTPSITEDGNDAALLTPSAALTDVNTLAERAPDGAWTAVSGIATGSPATVYSLAYGQDRSLYAGGAFTTIGGVADTAYIARWDGSMWHALATGGDAPVRAVAVGPDGSIYAGGQFTSMGGVANTAHIARWDGAAWHALGSGATNDVYALAFGPDGALYAAGTFTSIGGVTTRGVAQWNGSAWSALGTGINTLGGSAIALAVGRDGSVYAAGSFLSIGGVAATNVARWDGSAWHALGTGTADIPFALTVGVDGTLYMSGLLSTVGGVGVSGIAQWTGGNWSALGDGLTGSSPIGYSMTVDLSDGSLYVGGNGFSMAGGTVLPDAVARWHSGGWTSLGTNLPGTAIVYCFAVDVDGTLALGFYSATTTMTTAGVTVVTHAGTASAAPRVTFTGPGRVYQLVNTTTGKAIFFNLQLSAGEVATLDLTPGALSFLSSFRGSLTGTILPGSQTSTFALQPDANSISLLMLGTSAASSATMQWDVCHHAIDAGTPR